MKFRMQETDGEDHVWWEDYDKPIEGGITEARKEGERIIKFFNNTLRPNEKPRRILTIELLDASKNTERHDWEKQNNFSVINKGLVHDIYQCKACGITAKRFGICESIKIDPKYKAKVYLHCDTSLAHQKKLSERKK